jgi:tripartite-type tricarboxylate transporter receptor subunit TctC
VLVVNAALPVNNVAEFIAYGKAQGGKFNMASAGVGSVSHLAGAALASAAGFEVLHVPYKGGSQSVGSVVSGETQWTLTPAPAAMGLVKGGGSRPWATAWPGARSRWAAASDRRDAARFRVRRLDRHRRAQGLPQPSRSNCGALSPRPCSKRAARVLRAQWRVPTASSAEEFRSFLARDIDQNRKAIRVAGVQPE